MNPPIASAQAAAYEHHGIRVVVCADNVGDLQRFAESVGLTLDSARAVSVDLTPADSGVIPAFLRRSPVSQTMRRRTVPAITP